jgi:hypothetical protein
VLAELVHVLTDQKRFTQPLTMDVALQRARTWWTAAEVTQVFPTDAAVSTFVGWMNNYGLGRKRILDTLFNLPAQGGLHDMERFGSLPKTSCSCDFCE